MEPSKSDDHVVLNVRPRWDRDGGIMHAAHFPDKDGKTRMRRWRPTVNHVCDPLMGSVVHYKVAKDELGGEARNYYDGNELTKQEKVIYHVGMFARYPDMDRRLKLYREGLELVIVFRERVDLFSLAVFRRQVTEKGDIAIDQLFLKVARSFKPTKEEWGVLAARMPVESHIRRVCTALSGRKP